MVFDRDIALESLAIILLQLTVVARPNAQRLFYIRPNRHVQSVK